MDADEASFIKQCTAHNVEWLDPESGKSPLVETLAKALADLLLLVRIIEQGGEPWVPSYRQPAEDALDLYNSQRPTGGAQ